MTVSIAEAEAGGGFGADTCGSGPSGGAEDSASIAGVAVATFTAFAEREVGACRAQATMKAAARPTNSAVASQPRTLAWIGWDLATADAPRSPRTCSSSSSIAPTGVDDSAPDQVMV